MHERRSMAVKKYFTPIALIILFLIMFLYYSPIITADTESLTIIGETVNVRKQPGTEHPIITQVHKGETFEVTKFSNGWYEIQLPSGEKGWIAGWLADNRQKIDSVTVVVTADALNVRKEPSVNSERIGILYKDNQVKKLDEFQNWTKIEYEGITAWVSSDYIQEIEQELSTETEEYYIDDQLIQILYDGTNIRKKPTHRSKIISQISAGEIFEIKEKKGDWYKIEYASGKFGYVASWIVTSKIPIIELENREQKIPSTKPSDKNKKTIVLDPGHGGRDTGANGQNGTLEKELTLNISLLLANKLKKAGYEVVLTREKDEFISLADRTSLAQHYQADAFISLHFDSIDNRSVRGFTTYYYHERDQGLAEYIHNALQEEIELRDRGVRFGDYYVLRENTQPSVLLELGYISNPSEEQIIQSLQYQETVTEAIVQGLNKFFNNKN